jgi:hypothetical protein
MSDLRAFAVTEEDLCGIGNRHATGNGHRDRSRRCGLDFAVPGISRFPGSNESLRFIPVRLAGLFAVELLTGRAGHVNQAGALFPAAPSFFELPGTGVFQVAALTFFPVSAVALESHRASAHCTLRVFVSKAVDSMLAVRVGSELSNR